MPSTPRCDSGTNPSTSSRSSTTAPRSRKPGDDTFGLGTDVEFGSELGPRIFPRLLHAETDAPLVAVYLENDYLYVVALLDHL